MTSERTAQNVGHDIDVEQALNYSPTGQHLLTGELVLPFTETESETDGAIKLEVVGTTVKMRVYSRDLGAYITFTGLLEPAAATTDLKDAMVGAGIIEDGGETNLDLDGGDLTADAITATDITADSVTTGTIIATGGTISTLVASTLSSDSAEITTLDTGTTEADTLNATTINVGNINFTGNIDGDTSSVLFATEVYAESIFKHEGTQLGFFNQAVTTKRTITGSRGANAALADLLTDLAAYGLITDSTTA